MTQITKMTRADVRTVSEAAKQALQGVADQFGLTLTVPAGRFSDEDFRGRFTMAIQGNDGVPADFARLCGNYGLTPEDFGAEFVSNGRTFTITGIKPRRHKYPISGTGSKGGGYKFGAEKVVAGLKRTQNARIVGPALGARVAFESEFEGNAVGTIKSFLGNNRAEVFTTTGQTRTPQVSTLVVATRKRTEEEIHSDILTVYVSLSPENLTCDGECSRSEVNRRSRDFNKALKSLFKELGREVSEARAYAHASTPRAS